MGRLIDKYVPLRVRAAALMPAAVLTVHQLRFELAFGGRADSRLAAEGHQYLTALAPIAAMLVAIGAGLFLAALARARGGVGEACGSPKAAGAHGGPKAADARHGLAAAAAGGGPEAADARHGLAATAACGGPEAAARRVPGLAALSLAIAATLLAIYSAQELAEGMLVSGHPGGVAGVFGDGGLWALPLSLLLGAAVALLLRIGSAAIEWVAGRNVSTPTPVARPRPAARPAPVFFAAPEPLAALAAGRAPPLSLV